jgi:hypothetical protein
MGQADHEPEDCGRAVKGSVLLNHHLGGFYDGGDCVPFFQFEFVSAAAGDGTLNQVVSDTNDHMRHDIAKLNLFDCPA